MKIDIPWEVADQIVVSVLKDARKNLIRDRNGAYKVFCDDAKENRAEIDKHIDALNTVIRYFAG